MAVLRMALVGAGGIAQTYLEAQVAGAQIIAAADPDAAKLEALGQAWSHKGLKGLYSQSAEMLRQEKPDIAIICAPNRLHAPLSLEALEAGAHVLVEKPMASSVAEAEAMIQSAQAHHRLLGVGYQYRFHPAAAFLKRAAESGYFGRLLFARCQGVRRRGIPNWGVFGRKELQGGGPLIDLGVHLLEMAHYLMGSPAPRRASGHIWTYLGNHPSETLCPWPNWDWQHYNVEDLAVGEFHLENHAVIHLETAFAAHVEQDLWNVTLMGEKGGGQFNPPMLFGDQAGTMVNLTPAYLPETGPGLKWLFQAKLEDFLNALRQGLTPTASAEDGLAVQKMVEGLYRSAQEGREVEL